MNSITEMMIKDIFVIVLKSAEKHLLYTNLLHSNKNIVVLRKK